MSLFILITFRSSFRQALTILKLLISSSTSILSMFLNFSTEYKFFFFVLTLVVKNALTWGNFQLKFEQKKIALKNIVIFFSKKSHSKHISYTFLKFLYSETSLLYGPTQGRCNKSFSYLSSLYFYTHPLGDTYIVHNHIDASFFLLFVTHEHIDAFCLFFLQKDFYIFQELFLKAFLCFFIIAICHFHI